MRSHVAFYVESSMRGEMLRSYVVIIHHSFAGRACAEVCHLCWCAVFVLS